MGRFLVLTGSGLSIIVFALAFISHNRLYSKDLGQAKQLREQVRARLDARPELQRATWRGRQLLGQPTHSFEADLRQAPDRSALDALILYDETERSSFARQRRPDGGTGPLVLPSAGLAAPGGLGASYEAGAVSVRWSVAASTREVEPQQRQRLAHRIYRRESPGAVPRLVATVGLESTRWRDADMPLAGAELGYEIWTVLLHDSGQGPPSLVRSESSELVTVSVPEHFRLLLMSGDSEGAVLRMEVGPSSMPIAVHDLTLDLGAPIAAGDLDTGLVLTGLDVTEVERLETRNHFVFTSDASLVLDPVTQQPRTSQTQVLMPVKRLIAILTDPTGATRTLELDLP